MRHALALFFLVVQLACAAGPATRPHRAVHYEAQVRHDPPLRLHVVRIDLTDPEISVVVRPGGEDPDGAGEWETTLMTVRAIARRDELDIAINGDFFGAKEVREIMNRKVAYFEGNWARVVGLGMCDGKLMGKPINPQVPALLVAGSRGVSILRRPDAGAAELTQIISGSDILVEDGKPIALKDDRLAPRTAAGIDKAGKTLILVVVDGRRKEFSVGVTLSQLGAEMARLGCDRAINLDGGGSTTLVMKDDGGFFRVVNRPSDGNDFSIPLSIERPVANVLGIRWKKRD